MDPRTISSLAALTSPDRKPTTHLSPVDRLMRPWTEGQVAELRAAIEKARLAGTELSTHDELGVHFLFVHIDESWMNNKDAMTLQVSRGNALDAIIAIKSWCEPGQWTVDSLHAGTDDKPLFFGADPLLWHDGALLSKSACVSSFMPLVISVSKKVAHPQPLDLVFVMHRLDNVVEDLVHPDERRDVGIEVCGYTGTIPTGDLLDHKELVQVPIVVRPAVRGARRFAVHVGVRAVDGRPDDDAVYEAVGMQSFNAPQQVALYAVWNTMERRSIMSSGESIDLGGWPRESQGRNFNMGKFSIGKPLLLAFELLGSPSVTAVPPANLTLLCRKVS